MTDVHMKISHDYTTVKNKTIRCVYLSVTKKCSMLHMQMEGGDLHSDSCCFEGEKICDLICVEILLDRVVGALKRLQGSHTCKRQPSACIRVRTEELMKPERAKP